MPRPLHRLRSAVRCPTIKYNSKLRAGRGFSLDELAAAKINRKEAKGIGIAVDHRRRNKSEEGFNLNVQRLLAYKASLVIFPRNPSSQREKKDNSCSRDEMKAAYSFSQNTVKTVLPITNEVTTEEVNLIYLKHISRLLPLHIMRVYRCPYFPLFSFDCIVS